MTRETTTENTTATRRMTLRCGGASACWNTAAVGRCHDAVSRQRHTAEPSRWGQSDAKLTGNVLTALLAATENA
jgi:hypothetical protein